MCSHCDFYDDFPLNRKLPETQEVRPVEMSRPISNSGAFLPGNLGGSGVGSASPTCSEHSAICAIHHDVGGSVYTGTIKGQIPDLGSLTKSLRNLTAFLDELPTVMRRTPVDFLISGMPYPRGDKPATVVYILVKGTGQVLSAVTILGCRPDVIAALLAQHEVDKLIFNGE